jgi:hypothetical protein
VADRVNRIVKLGQRLRTGETYAGLAELRRPTNFGREGSDD